MTRDDFVEKVTIALDVPRRRAIVLIRRAVAVHKGLQRSDPVTLAVLNILREGKHPKVDTNED